MSTSTKSKGLGKAVLLVIVDALFFSAYTAACDLIRGRGGSKGVEVVTSGEEPMDSEDILGMKKRALIEAQRNAVEVVAGESTYAERLWSRKLWL